MQTADDIREKRFLIALRGYDRDEVEGYLDQLANEMAQLRAELAAAEAARDEAVAAARSAEAESKAVSTSAEDVPSAPAPSAASPAGDRRSLLQTLGEETTRILTVAEESAESIVSQAEREARELRETTQAETTELRESTEAEAAEKKAAAEAEARELRETAKADARAQAEQANRQAARVISEAERRRDRMAEEIRAVDEQRHQLVQDLQAAVDSVTGTVSELEQGHRDTTDDDAEEPAPAPAPDDTTDDTSDQAPDDSSDDDSSTDSGTDSGDGDVVDDDDGDAAVAEPVVEPAPADEDATDEPVADEADVAVTDDTEGSDAPAVDEASAEPEDDVSELAHSMTRDLRRGLQTIQSRLLESIRTSDEPELTGLLPSDAALDELGELAAPHFGDAYSVAIVQAAEGVDGDVPGQLDDGARVPAATATFRAVLAHEVTASLRPTLRAGLEAGESETSLSERVGEVFRDLKGPVLESLASQHVARVFGHGLLDAWRELGVEEVVWQEGTETRCPERRCAGNAEAGPTEIGEDFPSGDRVPPAHPGCTCTIAPA